MFPTNLLSAQYSCLVAIFLEWSKKSWILGRSRGKGRGVTEIIKICDRLSVLRAGFLGAVPSVLGDFTCTFQVPHYTLQHQSNCRRFLSIFKEILDFVFL